MANARAYPGNTTVSQSKAARTSFLPPAYFFFEDYRLWRERLSWGAFRLTECYRGRLPRRLLLIPLYALRGEELREFFNRVCSHLRLSLRRTPTWAEGHLMLASAEARLIETALEPDARGLRVVELEAEAFLMLQVSAAERREIGIAHTLLAWVRHARGEFAEALTVFERVLELPGRSSPQGRERAVVSEAAASVALALGMNERALMLLTSIPPEFRTPDVVGLIQRVAGQNSATFL